MQDGSQGFGPAKAAAIGAAWKGTSWNQLQTEDLLTQMGAIEDRVNMCYFTTFWTRKLSRVSDEEFAAYKRDFLAAARTEREEQASPVEGMAQSSSKGPARSRTPTRSPVKGGGDNASSPQRTEAMREVPSIAHCEAGRANREAGKAKAPRLTAAEEQAPREGSSTASSRGVSSKGDGPRERKLREVFAAASGNSSRVEASVLTALGNKLDQQEGQQAKWGTRRHTKLVALMVQFDGPSISEAPATLSPCHSFESPSEWRPLLQPQPFVQALFVSQFSDRLPKVHIEFVEVRTISPPMPILPPATDLSPVLSKFQSFFLFGLFLVLCAHASLLFALPMPRPYSLRATPGGQFLD
jgi:hypothetical protein